MARDTRLITWNGKDLPPEFRDLPAGRYLVEPADYAAPLLSPDEEAGIEAALSRTSGPRRRYEPRPQDHRRLTCATFSTRLHLRSRYHVHVDWPLYIVGGPRRFLTPGGPEEWGTPMPLLHRSIATIPEKELVAHVLNDVHYRDTLFNIKGLHTKAARVLEQIELRQFRTDLTGDVDILVVPVNEPELSTAIQVKRFKAVVTRDEQGVDDAEVGHPKRFQELMAKGVQQANETKPLASHRSTCGSSS